MKKNQKIKFLFIAAYNEYANGCRQLLSLLLEAGYDASILCFKVSNSDVKNAHYTEKELELLSSFLKKLKPDFIGFSAISDAKVDENFFFHFLKEQAPNAILMCGGFGPTLEPERFLHAGAHYVARGEGEGVILDVARCIQQGENLEQLENICYLHNQKLVMNPLRPLLHDLDTVPGFYHGHERFWYIENDTLYHEDLVFSQKIYGMLASRGCTSNCSYCCAGNWLDIYRRQYGTIKRYRMRSAENIIQELEVAKENGIKYIVFYDEYFMRSDEEFEKFFLLYKEKINLPFFLIVHTLHLIKSNFHCKLVTDAGLACIEIGVQSANKYISQNVFKRKTKPEDQFKSIILLYNSRVSVRVNFITAHALEGEKEYAESLNFIKNLPFDPSWTERLYLQNFALGLWPGAPISDMFPILHEKKYTAEQAWHKVLMLNVRHIVKDDALFNALYNDMYFRDNPRKIYDVLLPTLQKNAYHTYWANVAKELDGREVYFWGCGEHYHANKIFFKTCKPLAMLLNVEYNMKSIDGLSVLHPDEILPKVKDTPIIFFGEHGYRTSNRVLHNYPHMTQLYTHAPCKVTLPELR